jgi:peptide/nickel transport system substrate-binding protein
MLPMSKIRDVRRALLAIGVAVLLLTSSMGCELPGRTPDTQSDEPAVEQLDDTEQPSEPVDDIYPEQQEIPDEAYDIDVDNDVEQSKPPTRIVEAGVLEPRTLNPLLVADPLSEEISQLVFSGLVTIDPHDGQPLPDLAEEWEISEDGQTYTFHLRETNWHDGQPFTAHDVAFTYALMMDERTRSPRYSRLIERVLAVEAISSDTVEFRLSAPYAPFLTSLATFGIVPQHLLNDVLPDEMVTNPFGISSAVGTGPFVFNRWDRAERILFDAYGDYFRGPPRFDQYEYRVVDDEADIINGIALGSIDWARVSPSQVATASDHPDVRTVSIPSFEMVCVALHLGVDGRDMFNDQSVREALMLALDRERAVEEIWYGHAQVAHGTLPPASPIYQPSSVSYSYDPTRAADLLTEAGWTTSDEGIRMKDGMPLQFSVVANGDNPTRRALALFLVESWREIGIDVRVQFETWGSVRDRITTSREFDALVLGYRWEIDPDQHAMWSSVSIAHGYNLSGYVNLEVDRLLDEATAMSDDDLRSERYAEVQNIVMTDLPVLPLAFPNQTFAIGPRLRDIEPTAILVRNRAAIAEWVPVRNDEKGESDD